MAFGYKILDFSLISHSEQEHPLTSLQRGEWPSGTANSTSLEEVKHGCIRSETGWATIQMNDKSSLLRCPSEGMLNEGSCT